MLRKAVQALHPGQYGRGTNVAWTTQVNIYHIVYFIRIFQYLFDLKFIVEYQLSLSILFLFSLRYRNNDMSTKTKGFVGGLFRMAKRPGSDLFPFELSIRYISDKIQ